LSASRSRVRSRFSDAFDAGNLRWMIVGNVGFGIAAWLILSVLAHGGGALAVGEFTLAVAVTTPVMMFAQLRMRDVVATDATGEHPFGDYLTLTALMAVIAIPVVMIAGELLIGPSPVLWTVLAWAVAKAIETLTLTMYGLQQQRDDMGRVGRSMIARGILGVTVVAIIFSITESVALAAAGVAVAWLTVLVFYDSRGEFRTYLATQGFHRPGLRTLRSLALAGLPLGVFALLTSLNDNIPRLLLNEMHGTAALGIFGAFGFIIVGGSAVTRALGQSAAPRLAASLADYEPSRFRAQLLSLVSLAAGLGVVAMISAALVGRAFLSLAFGPEFAAHTGEFLLVVVYAALLFIASPLTVALIAARRYRDQLIIQIAAVVSVLIVGILAIPPWGIAGAALSLLVGGLVRVGASAGLLVVVIARLHAASASGGAADDPLPE